jgi:hypothetical protein
MDNPSLAELTAAAAASDGPGFPHASIRNFGVVDPLGLRQLNFDLMDDVLPGLNNVARHIRPFVYRRLGMAAGEPSCAIARAGEDPARRFAEFC